MFVNRIPELDLLEHHHRSGRAEFFVLYGRWRVGKTELLAHFCQVNRHVFFVADQVSAVYNTWDDRFTTLARQAQSEHRLGPGTLLTVKAHM